MPKTFKIVPKRKKFAKSGHTPKCNSKKDFNEIKKYFYLRSIKVNENVENKRCCCCCCCSTFMHQLCHSFITGTRKIGATKTIQNHKFFITCRS